MDEDLEAWTFHDVPVDSGAFGELGDAASAYVQGDVGIRPLGDIAGIDVRS